MPLYREDNFLVVHTGSEYTLFSFGLQDSLSPPQYKIPSIVYQNRLTKEYRSKKEADDVDLIEIRPIKGSKIVDLDAFNYLLGIILQSVISNNPIITINQIPLLLIIPSLTWSRANIELITKYVHETLEFTAFNILDLSIAATFGVGASSTSVVVNIGHESTQIVPIIGNQAIKFASKYLSGVGGVTINNELKKILPNLTDSQIQDLKVSGIYEVLNTHEGSFYSHEDLNKSDNVENNDEEFDVAKLVTENGSSVEINKDEESEEKEEAKPNNELETNYFISSETGEKIGVGKERFQGTNSLINEVADAIYVALNSIVDLEKRQECYDNLIFVGSTFKIPGFKQALLIRLQSEYLMRFRSENSSEGNTKSVNSAIAKYQQAEEIHDSEPGSITSQVPNSIKASKYPDYFPEWKKPKEKGGSWEDVYFLGGEIYAKQIFGANSNHGREMFLDADIYEENGPKGIWNVAI